MQIRIKDNTAFLKADSNELTQETLNKKSDEQIRTIFEKISERLKANGNLFDKITLFAPYSTTNLKHYAISFNAKTNTLLSQQSANDDEKVSAEQEKIEPSKMEQDERKKFVGKFLGNTTIINADYNKYAFNKAGGHVYMTSQEVEDKSNYNKYGCIPAIAYDVNATDFRAKKTNKLWRKLDGLVLDAQYKPFQISKFNITEAQEKNYNNIKRWTKLLLFGKPSVNDFNGKKTRFFEVDGVLASAESFQDNSSDTGRIELNNHTKFTQMGAESDPSDIWRVAAAKGLHGLAITDNSSVQAFSDEMNSYKKYKHLKPLYGVEMNQIESRPNFVFNPNDINLYDDNTSFVAFDIETTGLSTIHDGIIQLSAVRFKKTIHTRSKGKGKNKHEEKYFTYDVIDGYDHIVKVNKPIPEFIQKLTGITQTDSDNSKYDEKAAIQKFYDFINKYDNTVLVGHNVVFDFHFINNVAKRNGLHPIQNEVIDTLPIARRIIKNTRSYKLGKLATKLKIKLDNAHNSRFDAEATGYVLFALLQVLKYGDLNDLVDTELAKAGIKNPTYNKADININNGNDLREFETHGEEIYKEGFANHVDLIAKDAKGIKDLYELISEAHIEHFYFTPRILREEIQARKSNGNHFLYGSGNEGGKLYDSVTRYGYEDGLEVAKKDNYDYLEIVSISALGRDANNEYDFNFYKQYLTDMLKIAKETNAIPVIIGSTYYTEKQDKQAFEIIKNQKSDSKDESLKSADELKAELKPFIKDEQLIEDLVVNNTLKIANQCEDNLQPIKTKLTPPRIEGADEELTDTSWKRAHELYGKDLPTIITDRINKELKSIISNGYSVIYLTAKRLVNRANKNGYIVGSRGSVGGSLVAFLTGITEVNSLPPHYRSAHGDYLEFVDQKVWADGFDLPAKEDPNHPGEYLIGDGHGCSYEIFAGVSGKKVPDIDLNFPSDIQNTAQLWLKDVFGAKNVLRVGTVGTIADKTAYAKVRDYEKENNVSYNAPEVSYLVDQLVGVKRTSGQHAAGILIVPQDKDITDFSPYTWPANKKDSEWITTMFDKNMMHDSLLKMDCLGHDDPSVLHFMQHFTGVDPTKISQLQIKDVVEQIYAHPDRLGGTPEFGTPFAKNIVRETQPTKFSDLVQISGISHGTGVWLDNAQKLIENKQATIQTVIATRDKILNDLTTRGYPFEKAHEIVQIVKKGKPITPDIIKDLKELGLPDWYPSSLKKIGYLFPAAHAVAYVLSACRIGWFKLHSPIAFTAAWISYHSEGLEIDDIIPNDFNVIAEVGKRKIQELAKITSKAKRTKKIKEITSYSIVAEAMKCKERGYGTEMDIKFAKPDLNYSDSTKWIPDMKNNEIYLSFEMIPNVSAKNGEDIISYRNEHDGKASVHSKDYKDYGISFPKKAVENLIKYGLFED